MMKHDPHPQPELEETFNVGGLIKARDEAIARRVLGDALAAIDAGVDELV